MIALVRRQAQLPGIDSTESDAADPAYDTGDPSAAADDAAAKVDVNGQVTTADRGQARPAIAGRARQEFARRASGTMPLCS